MSRNNRQDEIDTLRKKLTGLDAEFEREMRGRGFDSSQAENVALPTQLAKLYDEREQIKTKIKELEEERAND